VKKQFSDVLRAGTTFFIASMIVIGALYLPLHRFYIHRAAFAEVWERLTPTLMLVAASVIIALILATLWAALSASRRIARVGGIVATVLFAAVCMPVFFLALMVQLGLGVHGVHIGSFFLQLPTGGIAGSDAFSIRDRVAHLILPATLLALVQAGAYVDCMRRGISPRALFSTFALLLPAILSADMVVEIIFAWPGEGRALYYYLAEGSGGSFLLAGLLVSSAIVIAVRAIARALDHEPDLAQNDVLEPL
jgi:peptide/nickel transport system permease protein